MGSQAYAMHQTESIQLCDICVKQLRDVVLQIRDFLGIVFLVCKARHQDTDFKNGR
jgi:hypothetical protein